MDIGSKAHANIRLFKVIVEVGVLRRRRSLTLDFQQEMCMLESILVLANQLVMKNKEQSCSHALVWADLFKQVAREVVCHVDNVHDVADRDILPFA